jgi:RecB family exonuclease
VVDYKSGRAPTAREIDRELHLQIPLYMLVLRDLVGIEPLGGVYRTLAGDARARGLLREEAREDGLQGFMQNDYVGEDDFWGGIERAREHAVGVVERIREGDVRHDPRGGSCPTWCELWPVCRVKRS